MTVKRFSFSRRHSTNTRASGEMKSRGRSPAPHTRPRDNLRGGSAGPRPGPGSSTYSSEAEDGQHDSTNAVADMS